MLSHLECCIFPLGHFVFTLFYCKVGPSTHPCRAFPKPLHHYLMHGHALHCGTVSWRRQEQNESLVDLVQSGGERSHWHLGRWTHVPHRQQWLLKNEREARHALCWKVPFEGCGTLRYETILSILAGDFLPPVARQDISRLNVVVAVSVVWNWAETTSSKCSWLCCFVLHQSVILVFACFQISRAKGGRPPCFRKSLINPGVKAV